MKRKPSTVLIAGLTAGALALTLGACAPSGGESEGADKTTETAEAAETHEGEDLVVGQSSIRLPQGWTIPEEAVTATGAGAHDGRGTRVVLIEKIGDESLATEALTFGGEVIMEGLSSEDICAAVNMAGADVQVEETSVPGADRAVLCRSVVDGEDTIKVAAINNEEKRTTEVIVVSEPGATLTDEAIALARSLRMDLNSEEAGEEDIAVDNPGTSETGGEPSTSTPSDDTKQFTDDHATITAPADWEIMEGVGLYRGQDLVSILALESEDSPVDALCGSAKVETVGVPGASEAFACLSTTEDGIAAYLIAHDPETRRWEIAVGVTGNGSEPSADVMSVLETLTIN